MASVMKMLNSFKTTHLHKPKAPPTPPPPLRDDPEAGLPSTEMLHRRKVSISKSGRYRENHKRRITLQEAEDESAWQDKLTHDHHDKLPKDDKNKENEKNKLNVTRWDSDASDSDGHAVADEIESLANTLTVEAASTAPAAT